MGDFNGMSTRYADYNMLCYRVLRVLILAARRDSWRCRFNGVLHVPKISIVYAISALVYRLRTRLCTFDACICQD
jgi:hypothetical protein